jgi:hypothetical protein
MEKGFNDDELADIMNEIESLEQEFASDDEVVKAQEPGIDEIAQSVAAMAAEEEYDETPQAEAPTEEIQVEAEAEEIQSEEIQSEEIQAEAEVIEKAPVVEHNEVEPQIAQSVDSEMNEVLDELSEMSVADVVPEKDLQSYDDNIHHMKVDNEITEQESTMSHKKKPSKTAKTSMSFSVEGDMKLDLSFFIDGSEVQLHVTDSGFEIELEGGAKFTLPVHGPNGANKAA